jgi:cyclase
VLTGPDGVLLVDSQFAPLTERLVAVIKKISYKPIRSLINTHVHADHTGGNENFAKLGVLIFRRDQLRARLQHPAPGPDGSPGTPAPAGAWPVVTCDGPVTIHLNGEEVHLIPIRNAHTDGHTLVSFSEHDILAVGGLLSQHRLPFCGTRPLGERVRRPRSFRGTVLNSCMDSDLGVKRRRFFLFTLCTPKI